MTPDAELEAAVKIAEIETTLETLVASVNEIRGDFKGILTRLEQMAAVQVDIRNLHEQINTAARRSDERWAALYAERRDEAKETRTWRSETDKKLVSHSTFISNLRWLAGVGITIAIAVLGWLKLK